MANPALHVNMPVPPRGTPGIRGVLRALVGMVRVWFGVLGIGVGAQVIRGALYLFPPHARPSVDITVVGP